MIVPRNILIALAAATLLPLSVMLAVGLVSPDVAAVIAGMLALAAVVDAALSAGRLDGISVELPAVTRLSKDREGEVYLEVVTDQPGVKQVRLALCFPLEFTSPHEDLVIETPAEGLRSLAPWPVTGTRRGNYYLDQVYLERPSALGLWSIRKTCATAGEVRVYPSTLGERGRLAALFLNRGLIGVHAQRQVGKGKEFEKLREYVPGDAFEDIHWKATAKRNYPVTKVFQIERTQELYVVIDAGRLSARKVLMPGADGEVETTDQLERFITAAMVLGLVAEKQGDLFGAVSFNDRVQSFVRAKNGKAHYASVRDSLYTLTPKMVNSDFGELFAFLRTRLRRRALLIFLTNLDDPILAENFARDLPVLARHHLVLVNMLTAPETAPLFADDGIEEVDELYSRLGGHMQWHKLMELSKTLKRRGVAMQLLDDELMCPQLVSQYINVKRRQLL